jgi:hypothetical protein
MAVACSLIAKIPKLFLRTAECVAREPNGFSRIIGESSSEAVDGRINSELLNYQNVSFLFSYVVPSFISRTSPSCLTLLSGAIVDLRRRIALLSVKLVRQGSEIGRRARLRIAKSSISGRRFPFQSETFLPGENANLGQIVQCREWRVENRSF